MTNILRLHTIKTVRKTTAEKPVEAATAIKAQPKTEKNDSFVIRIPRLHFKETSLNIYLVFALVIFAFILGMLTNKILYLEKQVKDANTANTATADANQAAPTVAPPPQVVKVANGKLPFLGNENAKVTVVEFSDFQCPFCKQYFDNTASQLSDAYIKTGKIKFYYRNYPLTSIHPNAQKAAEAGECANEQGKFWDYHDLLFQDQDTWAPMSAADAVNAFVNYAGQVGMDTDQFKSCLDSDKYKNAVATDTADGNKVQVDGTPTFFVNGYRLVGAQPFSEFQKVIDEQLKK